MHLSARSRMVAWFLAALAVLGYLVVLDLGLYAGRVHPGITVEGHDVGGLSFPELVDELERLRDGSLAREIGFVAGPYNDTLTGEDFGWNPQPFDTAEATYALGRSGPIAAIEDRVRAWLGGIDVSWEGDLREAAAARVMARWEREAGIDVDESAALEVIRRALGTGDGRSYEIPLS